MPFRRRGPPVPPSPPEAPALSDSDEEFEDGGPVEGEEEEEEELLEEEMGEMEEMGDDEEEELLASPPPSPSQLTSHLPPPNFREISTLASWTVSSSKPGCSIPQLRHPSTNQFWQSDGPQPHYLNIHFFKLVRIVGLRLYLDFEADESYTPTRIVLLAGSGMNDLVEWGEMRLESPRGWIWADFEGKPKIPVLRCHLVQIKILENHQNGKDTHLRGLQIFAMDGEKESAETARGKGIVRQRGGEGMNGATNGGGKGVEVKKKAVKGLMKSSWMGEASLR
ncbi:galactose-binding like protein [Massarina eburnea CBS 473.64]|uniref:Galactose-binding like protein n=1 Tax=Massarina eburnea CBS 473.64 TaxID=1395130 RepID=A0A6A6S659_9PLEO|nr:galactose-binding like protein [Massarina eburnea CBS 473.64]